MVAFSNISVEASSQLYGPTLAGGSVGSVGAAGSVGVVGSAGAVGSVEEQPLRTRLTASMRATNTSVVFSSFSLLSKYTVCNNLPLNPDLVIKYSPPLYVFI